MALITYTECNVTYFVQARQLENQIDTKLASFGKLGTNFSKSSSSGSSSSSAKTPLLAGDETSNQSAFESLSAELSQLLSRLSEVCSTTRSMLIRDT